jgi:hypothetical protein
MMSVSTWIRLRWWKFLVPCLGVALCTLAACGEEENFLEGSLGSQYDLSFESVRAREFLTSRQLHVEYVRGQGAGEEKPITVTIQPTPTGSGSFTYVDGNVAIDNSLGAGSPGLPEVTRATVNLEKFTPNTADSAIVGTIHANFTNSGSGDSFSLEGRFSTSLTLVP